MNLYKDHKIINSLRINAFTRYYAEVNNINEFNELKKLIDQIDLPVLIVGECTNLVLKDNFEGIVVKPMFNKIDYIENENIVRVGAAVKWHALVNEMVSKNIFGYENLSLIPGSVGAAPIQNIGAYGQEISNLINKVHCYDYTSGKFVSLSNKEILEKLLPNLITVPLYVLSSNNTLEPFPRINILPRKSYNFKYSIKPLREFGLKKIFVFPPILNQFKFLIL